MKKMILFSVILCSLIFSGLVLAASTSAAIDITWQNSADTYSPGSVGTVTLTFSNSGTDLSDVEVVPVAGPGLKLTSGTKINTGAIKYLSIAQSSITFEVSEGSETSASYIYLPVKYYTSSSTYDKSIYIPIEISSKPILSITNIKFSDDLEPGKQVTMDFDLVNSGSGQAKDIKLSFEQSEDFALPGTSGEIILASLGAGGSEKIEITVEVGPNRETGILLVPVDITYYNEKKTASYTEEKNISLPVVGQTDFIVNLEDTENLYQGAAGTIKISIANRGTGEARLLTLKARSEFGEEEIYMGDLETDDYDTIEIRQMVTTGVKSYPLTLELVYKDANNNDNSVIKEVTVYTSASPSSLGLYIFIILVIGGGVYWFKFRKKKK